MTSDGQEWALGQLNEICEASGGLLEVVTIAPPQQDGLSLSVIVSIDCRLYPQKPNGLPLRPRERLEITVPSDFPLDRPELEFTHNRFAGHPHVQWGRHVCLYQAPDSEWRPDDGMFGYMDRVHEWLRAGAAGELDPVGLPLHPPVAYSWGSSLIVIPRVDTPTPEPPWWAGYAEITFENDVRIELGAWHKHDADIPQTKLAPAILLPTDMPFEYPTTIAALSTTLAARGIPIEIVRLLLVMGALRNEAGKPLLFVLGAAMRGVAGGERKQHLACWYLDAEKAGQLRATALAADQNNPVDIQMFDEWTTSAIIHWCSVYEERPEIVTFRDSGTPMAWWRGRHVAILGCGAIGSAVAMLLGRAGAAKFQLYDNRLVTPGVLVRQLFDRSQIGQGKARATRFNIQYTNPQIEAEPTHENLVALLRDDAKAEALFLADVVINATASTRVAAALERRFRAWPKKHPPILSMVIGHRADQGLMTYGVGTAAGVTIDLDRRAKLAFANGSNGQDFLEEFWPTTIDRNRLFQPEPGCSDPTFRGSAADVLALTSTMLNRASLWMADDMRQRTFGLRLPDRSARSSKPNELEYSWPPDRVLAERQHGYQIRLDRSAEDALLGWMRRSARLRGPRVETGGVLFGQVDEFLKIIWINEVSGPPPDSLASHEGFVCGVQGVAALNVEKRQRTRGAVSFIGMWHTHPGDQPIPSCTDRRAMRDLLNQSDFAARNFLMLIIGGSAQTPDIAGVSLTEPTAESSPAPTPFLTLALSGGGSRAIAFHLGCLRALHDRKLLERIRVISSVSGGSVIGACYAYWDVDFAEFDRRVVALLRCGLQRSILVSALFSVELPRILATLVISGTLTLLIGFLGYLIKLVRLITGLPTSTLEAWLSKIAAALPVWGSLTTAFERALQRTLFGRITMNGVRRPDLEVVINACDLRTGTAFRFGSHASGGWRYGRIVNQAVTVAKAVAASAAYPLLLPPLVETFEFERRGRRTRETVVLTDGGIFENLGVNALEPGRDAGVSINTYRATHIISLNAGAGQFHGDVRPVWWPSRVKQSFLTIHRKVQDNAYARLHRYVESGELEGFVMVYLGQDDDRLPAKPPDLIPRHAVRDYPTDFGPMTRANIAMLAERGEQLTQMLVDRYLLGIT